MDELIQQLSQNKPLSPAQIHEATVVLVDEAAPAAAKADFLRALARKGETPAELTGFVQEFL